MGNAKVKRLRGRILVVQEDRFRLVSAFGKGYLLTLSHQTKVSEQDLQNWHKADCEVIVEYDGLPNLASGMVQDIKPSEF
jgi:hypothetical protein